MSNDELTGSEGACLFQEKAVLYRFNAEDSTWVSRGRGEVKLLQHADSHPQLVFHESPTLKVRLNHRVNATVELHPTAGSDRAWSWSAHDYSGDAPSLETVSLKFSSSEAAADFKSAYDNARLLAAPQKRTSATRGPSHALLLAGLLLGAGALVGAFLFLRQRRKNSA